MRRDTHTFQAVFFIKGFYNEYDQICRKLRIWSYLLKEYLMENSIFCAGSDSSHGMSVIEFDPGCFT